MTRLFNRFVMVSLDWCRPKDPVSLGSAGILAVLKQKGFEFQHLNYNVNSKEFRSQHVVSDILSRNLGKECIIGFGAYIWCENYIQQIISDLKNEESKPKF